MKSLVANTLAWLQTKDSGGEVQNVTGNESEGFIQLKSKGKDPVVIKNEPN